MRTCSRGILAYRRHPFRRGVPDPRWPGPRAGADCSTTTARTRHAPEPGRRLVLVVPSLVNRAHVLDLCPRPRCCATSPPPGSGRCCSTGARRGRGAGLHVHRLRRRPAGTRSRRGHELAGAAGGAGRLLHGRAARPGARAAPARAARGLACWRRPGISGPGRGAAPAASPPCCRGWSRCWQATGTLPVDMLQALFAALDPGRHREKYRAFGRLDPDSPGAPVRRAGGLAEQRRRPRRAGGAGDAGGWYGANTPARGAWRIAGEVVAPRPPPARLPRHPGAGPIVPPASARALADRCPARGPPRRGRPCRHGRRRQGGSALWRPLRAGSRRWRPGRFVGALAVCAAPSKCGATSGWETPVMTDIVIASAARTPVGCFNGAFASLPAHELGTVAIQAALERAGVKPEDVDEVILGQVLHRRRRPEPGPPGGDRRRHPGRAPGLGVNQLCGSGLRAVALGAQQIAAATPTIVVAGGQESMSQSPHAPASAHRPKMGDLAGRHHDQGRPVGRLPRLPHGHTPPRTSPQQWQITREEQDAFAVARRTRPRRRRRPAASRTRSPR